MKKIKVLFLCSGNSARSQMAEAFVRKYGSPRFEAYSAGLDPVEIDPLTFRVMEEIGIDLRGHCSKSVRVYMGKVHFTYLITVCAIAEARCPSVFPGIGQRLHWNFDDPAGFKGSDEERVNEFRRIRDQIDKRVREWLSSQQISEYNPS
jgi:arsenate reductase